MVDRLAPQVPENQRLALNQASGIDDRLPTLTESFTQWVVEDRFRYGRPPLETVGVEFRDNVAEWLAFKARIINATHVLISYPALLMGYRIVADSLTDPVIVNLAETFLDRDAKPNVQGPPGLSIDDYAAKFVPRFANPAIADQLLRVAGDGAAKLPTFHGQTIRMLIEKGADLRREACLMACFGRYLKFAVDPSLRDAEGAHFDPFEPGLSEEDWSKVREADPAAILRIRALQAFGLADQADFRHWFDHYAALLAGQGAEAALQDMLS
jgi:mannitol 2-dehydrogenase/sorbose reductase